MPASKKFIERLHRILDELDVSEHPGDRAIALAKILDVPTQKAKLILNSSVEPSPELLERMAEEFEVDLPWLKGLEKSTAS